jgi:transposase, IS5 family
MPRRRIGHESLGFEGGVERRSSLDDLSGMLDWSEVDAALAGILCAAKGKPGWPPLALFKALLPAVWYDLSDVKLAEALDDRASFRRFCGFARYEATPERTAFVRLRSTLIESGLPAMPSLHQTIGELMHRPKPLASLNHPA